MDDVLFDSSVRATVFRERYSRRVYSQLIRLLEDAEVSTIAKIERRLKGLTDRERSSFIAGNVTTKRLQEIVDQIRELAKTVRQTVNSELNISIKELVEAELGFSRELLSGVGIEAAIGSGISVTQAVNSIRSQPFSGRYLREYVKDFEPNVRKQMLQALRIGFVTGETTPNIARDLRDTFDITHRAASTLTRTALTHFAANSYIETYKALGIREIRYTSVLDGRTSSYCRGMSNRVFKIDSRHPTIPAHPNCRSVWTPVIPGEDESELVQPFVRDKRPVSKIPKSERDEKIGQVRGGLSYDEWLRRQPVSFQKEVLTGVQYRLFRKGKKLDKFIDMRSQTAYTSAELQKKYANILSDGKRAGN